MILLLILQHHCRPLDVQLRFATNTRKEKIIVRSHTPIRRQAHTAHMGWSRAVSTLPITRRHYPLRVSRSISFTRSAPPISYSSLPISHSYYVHSPVGTLLAHRAANALIPQPRSNALVVEAVVAGKDGYWVVLLELFKTNGAGGVRL